MSIAQKSRNRRKKRKRGKKVMRKSKKMLGLLLAVSLISASLAGCGGKNPDAPAEKGTEAKAQSVCRFI